MVANALWETYQSARPGPSKGQVQRIQQALRRPGSQMRREAALRRLLYRSMSPGNAVRHLWPGLTPGEQAQLTNLLSRDLRPVVPAVQRGARARMIAEAAQIGQERSLANAPFGAAALSRAGLTLIPMAFATAWAAMFNAMYASIFADTVVWECGGPGGVTWTRPGTTCGTMAFYSNYVGPLPMGATQGSSLEFIRIFNEIRYDYLVVGLWHMPTGLAMPGNLPYYGMGAREWPQMVNPLGALMHPAFGVVPAPGLGASLMPNGADWPRLPYRLVPHVRPNPNVSPSTQNVTSNGIRPQVQTRPQLHSRPGAGTVERKGGVNAAGAQVVVNLFKLINQAVRLGDDIYGAYTEFQDLVDAVYYSLPSEIRRELFHASGHRFPDQMTTAEKLQGLLSNYQNINLLRMITNIGSMQAMDMVAGRLNRFIDRLAFGGWEQSYIARRAIRYFVRGMAQQGGGLQF